MNKKFYIFIAVSVVIAAFFLMHPQYDLYVAGMFYDDGFFLDDFPLLTFLHKSVRYITITVALLWIGLLALQYLKGLEFWGLTKRKLAYLLLALVIGPGLVVNTVFKDNWGRARPHHTVNFGGTKEFTPPFIITDQCERNCSFVSGDPSVGFYFFALAFAIPRRRKLFISVASTLGVVFGATRVMQGAHFFSDVIFSGVFTFTVCYLLYLFMFRHNMHEK